VNRWEATPPYGWCGAWEWRLQIGCGYGTKTEICGHLHASSAGAGRCARELAAHLNSLLMPVESRIRDRLPSDYYLG
jgi:hypothetical protein